MISFKSKAIQKSTNIKTKNKHQNSKLRVNTAQNYTELNIKTPFFSEHSNSCQQNFIAVL